MSGPLAMIIVALVLVPFAGLFTALDAALSTVSRAQVAEHVRNDRAGASRLLAVVSDRPRHVNLLVLLRLACEVGATVLVTVAATRVMPLASAIAASAGTMLVISYVAIGVGPRTLGRQHSYR
ncbi:MAG: DUF21 domain-containing protein, partial [Mycobacteriaceae bacterium]